MKIPYILPLLLLPVSGFSQLKQIAFQELTAGSGMFFGAQMSTTTITVTVQGPSDRFLAFGFGTGMSTGNDAIIWSTTDSGVAPLQLRDHRMVGQGVAPTVDAQQDWTVVSNNVSGGNRTIVASRALNTGDANDVTFNFSATTQNLFWAKAASASNQIANHGGNRASGIVRNWVVVDQTAPTLTSTSPADNASGASLTGNLIATFSEPIALGTGSVTLYDAANNVIQTVSSGSSGYAVSGSNLVFNPAANLVANTSYYVHIDPTAVTDVAGNAFAGITDNTTWNFNTNDVTPPTLASGPFVPVDNATGVPVTTNLSVTFSEPVMAGSGTIDLYNAANTLIESFAIPSSPQVSISGATLTIDPSADLAPNTSYYLLISNGVVSDFSGNVYTGFVISTTWNFNTNDVTAPTAVSPFMPADNATDVALSTNLQVSFSEAVQVGTGNITVFFANGTPYQVLNVATATELTITGSTLTIDLGTDLPEGTSFYVNIAPTAITDLQGNAFAGITDQATWNFATVALPALTIATYSPADNATNVSTSATFDATFSEAIALSATGGAHLYLSNGTLVETFDENSGGISVTGSVLTIDPATNLLPLTAYYLTIDPGFVTTASGQQTFDGFTGNQTWNFTTEDDLGIDEFTATGVQWNGSVLTVDNAQQLTLSVFDLTGKQVKPATGSSIDCTDLVSGIYLVRVQSQQQQQLVRIYVD